MDACAPLIPTRYYRIDIGDDIQFHPEKQAFFFLAR
jgi:hypothetical protein